MPTRPRNVVGVTNRPSTVHASPSGRNSATRPCRMRMERRITLEPPGALDVAHDLDGQARIDHPVPPHAEARQDRAGPEALEAAVHVQRLPRRALPAARARPGAPSRVASHSRSRTEDALDGDDRLGVGQVEEVAAEPVGPRQHVPGAPIAAEAPGVDRGAEEVLEDAAADAALDGRGAERGTARPIRDDRADRSAAVRRGAPVGDLGRVGSGRRRPRGRARRAAPGRRPGAATRRR